MEEAAPDVATDLENLGDTYRAQGNYTAADPLYQRSLAIWEKALGPDHLRVASGLDKYAVFLHKMGRESDAAKAEAHAQAIRSKQSPLTR